MSLLSVCLGCLARSSEIISVTDFERPMIESIKVRALVQDDASSLMDLDSTSNGSFQPTVAAQLNLLQRLAKDGDGTSPWVPEL